uniref:Uncharacterized protein n=1 Tax=Romanomermis culicivorax TaxID=13658 RepID=A0A915HP59_ROMCU
MADLCLAVVAKTSVPKPPTFAKGVAVTLSSTKRNVLSMGHGRCLRLLSAGLSRVPAISLPNSVTQKQMLAAASHCSARYLAHIDYIEVTEDMSYAHLKPNLICNIEQASFIKQLKSFLNSKQGMGQSNTF